MEKFRQLTEIEKAALTYGYYNGVNQFEKIFDLCRKTNAASGESKTATVSKWKRSKEVQDFLETLKLKDEKRIEEKAKQLIKEDSEGRFLDTKINFTNANEFLKFANDKANEITDDKERREYLKIIADLMRFKEQGNNKETEIQRFYTQIHCKDCILYKNNLK